MVGSGDVLHQRWDLRTSISQPGEDGSKPCSISQRWPSGSAAGSVLIAAVTRLPGHTDGPPGWPVGRIPGRTRAGYPGRDTGLDTVAPRGRRRSTAVLAVASPMGTDVRRARG